MTLIRFTLRKGTAAEWATANPTLLPFEVAVITDGFQTSNDGTKRYRIKMGPGAFNSLNYASFESALGIADIAGLQATLDEFVTQSALDTAIDNAVAGLIADGGLVTSGLTFQQGAMRLADTANSQVLIINVGEDLSANRTLTLNTGNANRVLTLEGDATLSGVNTGDGASDPVGSAAAAEAAAKAYADGLVVGLFDDRGNYDASAGTFPATGGSGTGGAVLKGDVWRISVAGTLGGEAYDVGDTIRALVDSPGQTASNWARFEANVQQATESTRGTAAIATQAEAEDDASTNDIDIVTPRKLWQAFAKAWTLAAFFTAVRGTLLTGLSSSDDTDVAATDSILAGIGKLKRRLNDLITTVAGKQASNTHLTAISGLTPTNDDVMQYKSGAWTNRTLAQLVADLGSLSGVALRTGATIAFDTRAIYNTPTSPSSSTVTLDLSGAAVATEVVACFNHASEPSWPSGVSAVGLWNNSALNIVRFTYIDSSNIVAVINSDATAGSTSNVWTPIRKTTATARNSTTVLAADPDLKLALAANQKVNTRWIIAFVTGATGDFKYRIVGPGTPTLIRGVVRVTQTSGTAPANRVLTAYDTSDQAITAAAGFTGFIEIELYVENGATPGDLEFQWAQNTTDATNTTVSRGALLEYLFTP